MPSFQFSAGAKDFLRLPCARLLLPTTDRPASKSHSVRSPDPGKPWRVLAPGLNVNTRGLSAHGLHHSGLVPAIETLVPSRAGAFHTFGVAASRKGLPERYAHI